MPRPRSNINSGDRFGPSVIIKELKRIRWDRKFLVKCDCGKTHVLPLKKIKSKKICVEGKAPPTKSQIFKVLKKFPDAPRDVKASKVYELWVSIRREEDAPVCDRWQDLVSFIEDFATLMGGEPLQYLQKRTEWVYYTIERIDLQKQWEPDNVTVRKFQTERAFHRKTYGYWKLLGNRNLLTEEFKTDYILFINTFGEKQTGYVLRRRNPRLQHSRDNSFWANNGRKPRVRRNRRIE